MITTQCNDTSLTETTAVPVRTAKEPDLDAVVAIHQAAFPKFFLTLLGSKVLRIYYRSVMEYRPGIILVAAIDGVIVGFVAGFSEPAGFYRYLRSSHRFQLMFSIAERLLLHPQLLPRVLTNYRRAGQKAAAHVPRSSELASLAVLPQYEGRSAGRCLVDAFIGTCAGKGARSIVLTTDATANERVNQFYVRRGFRLWRTLEIHSRLMNEYRYELPSRD